MKPEKTGTIWRRADSITDGKNYILVNYGYNSSSVQTYAIDCSASAIEVEVETDNEGEFIVNDDTTLTWCAKANNNQFELKNIVNGYYLSSSNYVYGSSASAISVQSSVSSGSTYTNWNMETVNGSHILAVRRASSNNFYPVRYNDSNNQFESYNSSQVSQKTNWLVVFEETDETAGCKHNYTVETLNATCLEKGVSIYTCIFCGDTYQANEIDALGHNYTTIKNGNFMIYTCENCGDSYSITTIEKPSVSICASKATNQRIKLTGTYEDYENLSNYYNVTAHGIIYMTKSKLGTKTLTVNTSGRTKVNFSSYSEDGTFSYTFKPTNTTTNYVAKAFLAYVDESGVTQYVYSNPILVNYQTAN